MRKIKEWFSNAAVVLLTLLVTVIISVLLVIAALAITAFTLVTTPFYIVTGISQPWTEGVTWKTIKRDIANHNKNYQKQTAQEVGK